LCALVALDAPAEAIDRERRSGTNHQARAPVALRALGARNVHERWLRS